MFLGQVKGSLLWMEVLPCCFFSCRYVNDGRPFWQFIVSSSTGCSDHQYFEELYNYYTTQKVCYSVFFPAVSLESALATYELQTFILCRLGISVTLMLREFLKL